MPKPFEFALCMAGAVSGGAYTAGVLDFLFEALDHWEAEKQRMRDNGVPPEDWTIPGHEVRLKAITGASAGSLNAGIAAITLYEDFDPVTQVPPPDGSWEQNKLYGPWVERIDIRQLLESNDLKPEKAKVKSLLDSSRLDEIVATVLPMKPGAVPRAYLADVIHIILTVTNLRGVPYDLSFEGGPPHEMAYHADWMHFAITAQDSSQLDPGVIPLPVADPLNPAWQMLAQASLASSAFPVGLAPRVLGRDASFYNDRDWSVPRTAPSGEPTELGDLIVRYFKQQKIDPLWGDEPPADYRFTCVDGGVMNNEPFAVARQLLSGGPHKRNPRDPKLADRAVLMVDPFPNTIDYDGDQQDFPDDLLSVIGGLKTAVVQNARFKKEDLQLAQAEDVFSRFLVAPSRREKNAQGQDESLEPPLAAGTLGAFGGFLDKGFRQHDYMLGRRNCQRFLQRYFVLHPDNAVFDESVSQDIKDGFNGYRFDQDGAPRLPIVPVLPELRQEIDLSDWPAIPESKLEPVFQRAGKRAKKVVNRLLAQKVENRLLRWGLQAASTLIVPGQARKTIRKAVTEDLHAAKLLKP